jgi:hypothetical protein
MEAVATIAMSMPPAGNLGATLPRRELQEDVVALLAETAVVARLRADHDQEFLGASRFGGFELPGGLRKRQGLARLDRIAA